MAGYTYRGTETIQAAIERQQRLQEKRQQIFEQAQQLAAAEAELRRRLHETQQQIKALPIRSYKPTEEALAWRDRPNKPQLPPPIHGGRAGLEAAAREAATWDISHRRGTWAKDAA